MAGDGRLPERRCVCGHLESEHYRYADQCGECDCEMFVLDYPANPLREAWEADNHARAREFGGE